MQIGKTQAELKAQIAAGYAAQRELAAMQSTAAQAGAWTLLGRCYKLGDEDLTRYFKVTKVDGTELTCFLFEVDRFGEHTVDDSLVVGPTFFQGCPEILPHEFESAWRELVREIVRKGDLACAMMGGSRC